jgi:CRAL/TRIO domain
MRVSPDLVYVSTSFTYTLPSYPTTTSYRSPLHRTETLNMHLTLLFYSIIISHTYKYTSYLLPLNHTVQKHLVYTMERAVAVGDQAAKSEKIVLIIDYEGFTLSGGPPMKTSQETLSILQNHYPERLQCAYLIR